VLAGIDEGLRRSGPGRDGKQQEKKFLHCMTVWFRLRDVDLGDAPLAFENFERPFEFIC